MNQKIAIALTILFILIGLKDVFNVLYFYSNQDYFIKKYCINVTRPEILCHGKCYLSKQLDKSVNDHKKAISLTQLFDHLELKVVPIRLILCVSFVKKLAKEMNWNFDRNLYRSDYCSTHFHPPPMMIS